MKLSYAQVLLFVKVFIAVVVVLTATITVILGITLPDWYVSAFKVLVGFFFGSQIADRGK